MQAAQQSLPVEHAVVAQVRAAVGGSRAAQQAIFSEHHRAVMAYCLLATHGDRSAAMDLVQEIFGRAFVGLGGLSKPELFKGWLFTIAANVCRARGEQEGRRRALLEGFALQLTEAAPADESTGERERRIARVRELVAEVKDDGTRAVLAAHYVEGEPTRQIAERLNVPHGTVTVKLMRFRDRLKRDFAAAIASGDFP